MNEFVKRGLEIFGDKLLTKMINYAVFFTEVAMQEQEQIQTVNISKLRTVLL